MNRYWPNPNEITENVATELNRDDRYCFHQAIRVLSHNVNLAKNAYEHDDLAIYDQAPTNNIDVRWDTLIASAIRYRLRTLKIGAALKTGHQVQLPSWTFKEPLDTLWWPISSITLDDRRGMRELQETPPELIRCGIIQSVTAFEYKSRALNEALRKGTYYVDDWQGVN